MKRQSDRRTEVPHCDRPWLVKMNHIIIIIFKNDLQHILPSTLSISDVQTSNIYITTNRISIYIYKVAH